MLRSLATQRFVSMRPLVLARPFSNSEPDAVGIRRRRMLYRCVQRGMLELDLVVGGWARANIFELPEADLDALQVIIDQENPDLMMWLIDKEQGPDEIENNEIFKKIRGYVPAAGSKFMLKPEGGNQHIVD